MKEKTPKEHALEMGQALQQAEVIAHQAEQRDLLRAGELAATAGYSDERDLINQLFGQVQMARSLAKFADVVSLAKLAHIKESKSYQAFRGKLVELPGGETADVSSWAGFCRALGTSHQKVDEDLRNLAVFGEEALDNLNRIGAGYRELRRLRRLPADDRQAILESDAAKAGDKEELQEMIEKLEERLTQKAKEADGLAKDLAAKEAVLKDKQEHINKLDRQLTRRESMQPDERAAVLERDMDEAVHKAIGALLTPATAALAILEWDDAPEALRLSAMQGFERIRAALNDTEARLGIPDTTGGLVQPWTGGAGEIQVN